MARHTESLGSVFILTVGSMLSGCASLPEWAQPEASLRSDLSLPAQARLARLQVSDNPGVTLKKPTMPTSNPGVIGPPPGVEQASLTTRSPMAVSVRAWVNGKPIFDDEVLEAAKPGLLEAKRAGKMTELFNSILDQLIDQEVLFQDAVKKLEKANPKGLDKLKEFVEYEFDKSVQKMREANWPEDQIRKIEPVARRMMERNLISMEYVRSRIRPIVETRIGLTEIREYYEDHKKEFFTEDRVEWKDIFIPINPNQPTIDELKRFAEEQILRCRTAADLNKLMIFNEGDSKLRNGDGLGNKRGEIRPPELEEHLFTLGEGIPGPVVAFSTGVHVFWVTKREVARQLPLTDDVQKVIRKKLENQLADREYRRLVRELRQRAVVRIEKETP